MKCFDLSGRVAFVTGGSRGLGLEFSEGLAEAGADLFLTARNADKLAPVAEEIAKKYGRRVEWTTADIESEAEMQSAADLCVEKFGKIDILINCAANGRINKPAEETTLAEWREVMIPNLDGAFIVATIIGRQMIKQGYGKVVNIASMSGIIINKGFHGGSYDVSKAGIVAFSKALAEEWAKYNINVNTLAPGYFLTYVNEEFFEKDPEARKIAEELSPMKRCGRPEEIRGAIVFLASDAASFMQGSVVVVDGGYTIY
ncbi:short-chain dehydrogenase [Clostridia bacterium]|nr:short-chain dehydrogenase [Clostridia bacterium]